MGDTLSTLHYTDAMLSVLFAGGFLFMLWSVKEFRKIDSNMQKHRLQMVEMENRLLKKFNKIARRNAKFFLSEINHRDKERKQ